MVRLYWLRWNFGDYAPLLLFVCSLVFTEYLSALFVCVRFCRWVFCCCCIPLILDYIVIEAGLAVILPKCYYVFAAAVAATARRGFK